MQSWLFCNVQCTIVCIHLKATMLPWKYNSRWGVIGVTNFITFRVTLQGCGVINFQRRALWNLLFCNFFLAILTELCLSSTHRFYVHRYSLLGGILFTHSNKLSINSHSLFYIDLFPNIFIQNPDHPWYFASKSPKVKKSISANWTIFFFDLLLTPYGVLVDGIR